MSLLLPIGSRRGRRIAAVQGLVCLWLLCGCASTGAPPATAASAGASAPGPVAPLPSVLEVRDARLLPALRTLLDRSPRVSRALNALASSDARIRVHTYETAVGARWVTGRFAYGYTQPYFGPGGRVDSVDVAIQWDRLEWTAAALGLRSSDFELDVAVFLGHELFGHAIPLLEAGTLSGECGDVLPGGTSCSVTRENVVRADLGVRARPDYLLVCLPVTTLRDTGITMTRGRGGRRCG